MDGSIILDEQKKRDSIFSNKEKDQFSGQNEGIMRSDSLSSLNSYSGQQENQNVEDYDDSVTFSDFDEEELNARPITASNELETVGSTIVKKGAFAGNALNAGLMFMNKVDQWLDKPKHPSNEEKAFYKDLGSSDTVDYLYVDGMPLKEFVSKQYNYRGSDDPDRNKGILSAYVAMIIMRQNHAVTIVRPTIKDGQADVEIRNLDVDMDHIYVDRREVRKVEKNAQKSKEYVRYCNDNLKADMLAKASKAARGAAGKNIDGMNRLDTLMETLKSAGKGKHQDYRDFAQEFSQFYNALVQLTLDTKDMNINKAALEELDRRCRTVITAANVYLDGKKMNLPRHHAVRDIRDFASKQSGIFFGILKSGALDDGGTMPLGDILDKKEDGFVLAGTEDEVNAYQENPLFDENDRIEYEELDPELSLTVEQEALLREKEAISVDKSANIARTRLLESLQDDRLTEEARADLAEAFLKSAADALLSDEKYRKQMLEKYPFADYDPEILKALVARTRLSKIYPDIFKSVPALKTAQENWDKVILPKQALAMSFESCPLKGKISKEQFEKNGGTSADLYVTEDEAKKMVELSGGFVFGKKVKEHPGIVLIRPTMPQTTKLPIGWDDVPDDEKVPLRKTMKTMYKLFTRLITEANGTVNNESKMYKGESVSRWIDRVLNANPNSANEINPVNEFIEDFILPEMTKMLEEEYRQKGIRKYKDKAEEDTADVLTNFEKILHGSDRWMLSRASDCSFEHYEKYVQFFRSAKVEDIMNHKFFKDYKIGGEYLTEEEVREALEDLKTDMFQKETEFGKLRDMDLEDPEMPQFGSCKDNAMYLSHITQTLINSEKGGMLEYKLENALKADPNAMLDRIIANLDNFLASKIRRDDDKTVNEEKEFLLKLDVKRKTQPLDEDDMSKLIASFREYTKYESHIGFSLGTDGNIQYTTETFGMPPHKGFPVPMTNRTYIGRYISQKPNVASNFYIKNEGMNNYYNQDDPIEHTKTRKNVATSAVKQIIFSIVDDQCAF